MDCQRWSPVAMALSLIRTAELLYMVQQGGGGYHVRPYYYVFILMAKSTAAVFLNRLQNYNTQKT